MESGINSFYVQPSKLKPFLVFFLGLVSLKFVLDRVKPGVALSMVPGGGKFEKQGPSRAKASDKQAVRGTLFD